MSTRASALFVATLFAVAIATTAVFLVPVHAQTPRFRGVVDLIAVDVQVIDGKGNPVLGLGADKFQVSVNGRPRRIVSAELVSIDPTRAGVATSNANATPDIRMFDTNAVRSRIIVLAIDAGSFAAGDSAGALEAARGFIARLQPNDQVGLFAFPRGPQVEPTRDHAAVLARLDSIVGQRVLPVTRYNPRPSDVITISRRIEGMHVFAPDEIMKQNPDIRNILEKTCPENGPDPQLECFRMFADDVQTLSQHFETEAAESLSTLRALLQGLGRMEGRKTLVLLSGGMVVSDQAGGRPDLGNLDIIMAQDAARANTAIYTLFVDWKFLERFRASSGRLPPNLENLARDTSVNSHWLERFSTTAGGKLFTISAGSGDVAFDRILSETSAHYLLGIAPEDADRDGQAHPLSVKVNQRGTTVRARSWFALPAERPVQVAVAVATPLTLAAPPTGNVPAAATVATTTPASAPADSGAPRRAPAERTILASTAEPAAPEAPRPAYLTTEISPALKGLLSSAGRYVKYFDTAFANVVSEERYRQTATPGSNGAPVVRDRELVSDFLLVTLPGTTGWVPFRDVFEVNGAQIRDHQDRLTALFLQPDTTSIARAWALLDQSASYNIGVERTMNLPTLGLEVLRAESQPRFRFAGGWLDASAGVPASVVEFSEYALPSLISGRAGRNLLMHGRIWIDVTNGAVVRTELSIDDATMQATVVTKYQFIPAFGVAIPIEMTEQYVENSGRRTAGTATYGRFRRFGVETTDDIVVK